MALKPSERLAVLEERVDQWMQNTTEYRRQKDECTKVLFHKIDKISDALGEHKGVKWQLAAIWMFIIGGVSVVVKHFVEGK